MLHDRSRSGLPTTASLNISLDSDSSLFFVMIVSEATPEHVFVRRVSFPTSFFALNQ